MTSLDTKICTSCGQKKHYSDMKKEKRSPTGVGSICKKCNADRQNMRYHKDKPEYNAKYRRIKTLAQYGITLEDYDEMWEAQKGCCQICGIEEKYAPKGRFHVDHDHESGEVRGLLCAHCNKGLGMFRDNSEFLAEAVNYLRQFGK